MLGGAAVGAGIGAGLILYRPYGSYADYTYQVTSNRTEIADIKIWKAETPSDHSNDSDLAVDQANLTYLMAHPVHKPTTPYWTHEGIPVGAGSIAFALGVWAINSAIRQRRYERQLYPDHSVFVKGQLAPKPSRIRVSTMLKDTFTMPSGLSALLQTKRGQKRRH